MCEAKPSQGGLCGRLHFTSSKVASLTLTASSSLGATLRIKLVTQISLRITNLEVKQCYFSAPVFGRKKMAQRGPATSLRPLGSEAPDVEPVVFDHRPFDPVTAGHVGPPELLS